MLTPHNFITLIFFNKFTISALFELKIMDTTDLARSASCLDLHLKIDSEGRLRTKPYDKRNDFNFPIMNFPFICSTCISDICSWYNIPELMVPIMISSIEGCC